MSAEWDGFQHPPNVYRSLRHSWEPATKCRHKICTNVPACDSPTHPRPILWDGALRVEGLLNVCNTAFQVIGPLVFKHGQLVRRGLSSREVCRVFDLPLYLDSVLGNVQTSPDVPLPFEDAVSPAILAFIFRYVWGFVGGLVDGSSALRVSDHGASWNPAPPLNPAHVSPTSKDMSVSSDSLAAASSDSDLDSVQSGHDLSFANSDRLSVASSDFDLESIQSGHDPIIVKAGAALTQNWECESDDDSLMPR
jgi:hypothetical protein